MLSQAIEAPDKMFLMPPKHQLQHDSVSMTADNVFQAIVDKLQVEGLSFTVIEHEPVYTMEQACEVCGNSPEEGVKVLFARMYKSKKEYEYCLVVWTGNKPVDFKQIANLLEAKKIKLASPEEVKSNLGIEIGALSPFGYSGAYPVVFDSNLLQQEILFINAGVHNRTIKLASKDLRLLMEQSALSLQIV